MSESARMQQLMQQKQSARWNVNTPLGLLLMFVLLLVFLRFTSSQDYTLSYDEAVIANIGHEIIRQDFSSDPTSQLPGATLFPLFVGWVAERGGESGLRLMTVMLNMITAIAVYLITRELFSEEAAMWAIVLFGLSGVSLNLAHYGILDSASMPLLAVGLYFIIISTRSAPEKQIAALIYGGIFCALAVLTSYTVSLYLPAVVLVSVLIYTVSGEPIARLITVFGAVFVIITGVYVYAYWEELRILVQNFNPVRIPGAQQAVIRNALIDSWPVLPLALVGGILLAFRAGELARSRVTTLFLGLLATLAIFAVPAYLIVIQDTHRLWVHVLYSLVFIAPAAGYSLEGLRKSINTFDRGFNVMMRLAGASLVIIMVGMLIRQTLNVNWGMLNSWPNATAVVNYFYANPPTPETRILAENADVLRFYLERGAIYRDVWNNTFGFNYGGLQGADAMSQAITDHYFDYVVLDDYFTPETNVVLREALGQAGYTIIFQAAPQALSTEQTITTQIYGFTEIENPWLGTTDAWYPLLFY